MKNKTLFRTVLSLALCLVVCASLFCMPAFAAGNTLVIIGNKVDKNETAAQTKSVVVSGGSSGSTSNSGSGIASDGAASTQVIIGSKVDDGIGRTEPSSAVVVQPDGTIVSAGKTEQKQETAAAPANVLPVAAPAATEPTGLAAELFAKVNQARTENGVGTLKYSSALQSIADLRVKESVVSFGHTRPDGSHCSTAVTVDYQITGENLVQGPSEHLTTDLMMETWMNSETHRYNILLSQFTDMAVGVYTENGTTYVSMIFVG